jgi:hypothetical protein
MILTVDNLASRYHVLPTEVMSRATTFDMHVMDVATRYARHQQERAEIEQDLRSGRTRPVAPPDEQQMQDMLERVRTRNQ